MRTPTTRRRSPPTRPPASAGFRCGRLPEWRGASSRRLPRRGAASRESRLGHTSIGRRSRVNAGTFTCRRRDVDALTRLGGAERTRMKPLAWVPSLVASLAIACPSGIAVVRAPAFAQPLAAISLATGRSTTIDAPGLSRVAVGDGRIAGVVPLGTQQLIVNAKGPGHTTIIVWARDGRRDYDVTVTEQTLDDLAQMLRTTLDVPGVTVEPVGRALIIKGDISDQSQANRIADVLGRFASLAKNQEDDIVNAVTVSHPLGAMQNQLTLDTGARDGRVDYDIKGNVMVSGRVRDRASAEAV